MASKMDRILESMGSNIAESIGLRALAPAAGGTKYEGIKLARDKGEVPLDRLAPDPDQPRKQFEEASIRQLAASAKTIGILQPLRVRWSDELGKWKILTGERRYRAALEAGLPSAPCILLDRDLTQDEAEAEQLAENYHRQDLAPLELARALQHRMQRRGLTQTDLAAELGIDRSSVTRALACLKLPDEVQAHVTAGKLDPTTAYEVSKLPDARSQREVADEAVAGKLTAAAVKDKVKERTPEKDRPRRIGQPLTLTYRHDSGLKVTVRIEPGARRKLVENWQELAAQIDADLRQKSGRRPAA
jgi:ParB family chromosome partitioning protein